MKLLLPSLFVFAALVIWATAEETGPEAFIRGSVAKPLGKAALVGLAGGTLVYGQNPDGDPIPDYSLAGYRGGGVAIPLVPVMKTVSPSGDDDTVNLQGALDACGDLPFVNGFRGAVLLKKGRYTISNTLRFAASGVVVRGEGAGFGGTWIFHKRVVVSNAPPAMVHFPQKDLGVVPTFETSAGAQKTEILTTIASGRVGSGARTFMVKDPGALAPGLAVVVKAIPQASWISALGLASVWKKPDEFVLTWERTVKNVSPQTALVELDVALTSVINLAGGLATGEVHRVVEDTRLSNVGFEDLMCVSDFDSQKKDKNGYYVDENHPSQAFRLYGVQNAWIRRAVSLYYSYGLCRMNGSSFVTVEDCAVLDGVSTDTPKSHVGARKYYIDITGNQVLVQRCYGRNGRHTFTANGPCTGGVFLDSVAEKCHLGSEGHQRWSHGFLYDNVFVDSSINATAVKGGEHGVRMASTMIWNCLADQKRVWEPEYYLAAMPGLFWNYAVGNLGRGGKGIWPNQDGVSEAPTLGQLGWVESHGAFVEPRSLYQQQLSERLGPGALNQTQTAAQRGARGAVWLDLIRRYRALPEYVDPAALPWKGFEGWVAGAPIP